MNRGEAVPSKMFLAFGDPVVSSSSSASPAVLTAQATRSATAAPGNSLSEEYAARGFSSDRLPYTREEVLAISTLFSVSQRQAYLGDDAREETVKSEKLDQFRYIHFASHGFMDESHPGRSGILLSHDPHSSEDGILQMGDDHELEAERGFGHSLRV